MDPRAPSRGPPTRHSSAARPSAQRLHFFSSLSLLACLAPLCGCFSAAASSGVRKEAIVIPVSLKADTPVQIDLGNMDASRRIERSFLIENRCASPISIARIDANCECLHFEGALVALQPNQIARATLVVDLQEDPDFKGLLGVPATGFDTAGRPVFAAVVCTRVAP